MVECWKGLFGNYQISNLGNIKNVKTGNVLKTQVNKGYARIGLYIDGKSKQFSVHRLVAQAFLPNPQNLPCINHKDNNRLNNCVNNLEWCSYGYNNDYCYNQSRNPHQKITNEQVCYIRQNYNKIGCSQLAKKFGVSVGLICDIAHYKKRV